MKDRDQHFGVTEKCMLIWQGTILGATFKNSPLELVFTRKTPEGGSKRQGVTGKAWLWRPVRACTLRHIDAKPILGVPSFQLRELQKVPVHWVVGTERFTRQGGRRSRSRPGGGRGRPLGFLHLFDKVRGVGNGPRAPLHGGSHMRQVHQLCAGVDPHVLGGRPPQAGVGPSQHGPHPSDHEGKGFLCSVARRVRVSLVVHVLRVDDQRQGNLVEGALGKLADSQVVANASHKAAAQEAHVHGFLSSQGLRRVRRSANPRNAVGPRVEDIEFSFAPGQQVVVGQENKSAGLAEDFLGRGSVVRAVQLDVPEGRVADDDQATTIIIDGLERHLKVKGLAEVADGRVGLQNSLDRRGFPLKGGDHEAHVEAKLRREPLKAPEKRAQLPPLHLGQLRVDLPSTVGRQG